MCEKVSSGTINPIGLTHIYLYLCSVKYLPAYVREYTTLQVMADNLACRDVVTIEPGVEKIVAQQPISTSELIVVDSAKQWGFIPVGLFITYQVKGVDVHT